MMVLREKLQQTGRPSLLLYMVGAIHGFTIMARDDIGMKERLAINNCIRYLAGHIAGLSDPAELLTDSRLDGIIEQIAGLNSSIAEQIEAELIG